MGEMWKTTNYQLMKDFFKLRFDLLADTNEAEGISQERFLSKLRGARVKQRTFGRLVRKGGDEWR